MPGATASVSIDHRLTQHFKMVPIYVAKFRSNKFLLANFLGVSATVCQISRWFLTDEFWRQILWALLSGKASYRYIWRSRHGARHGALLFSEIWRPSFNEATQTRYEVISIASLTPSRLRIFKSFFGLLFQMITQISPGNGPT